MVSVGDTVKIRGTSIRSRLLETSLGVPSLDALLGGSAPLSSVIVFDECGGRTCLPIIEGCFLAEGVYNGHDIFIASPYLDPKDILTTLPTKICDFTSEQDIPSGPTDPELKIAWRYSTVPKINSHISEGYDTVRFDFSKSIDKELLEKCLSSKVTTSSSYSEAWSNIYDALSNESHSIKKVPSEGIAEKNVLRILIKNYGSSLWEDPSNYAIFLSFLRVSLGNRYAIVMITMNSDGLTDEQRDKIYSYSDAAFRLEAVTEEEMALLGDKFDGYLRILRLPAITSVATYCPTSVDLVYEVSKRRFRVRTFHLPPAFQEKGFSATPPCQGFSDKF